MKILRQTVKINVQLTEEETKTLTEAISVLEDIRAEMVNQNCGTFLCSGEFCYDISDLEVTIDDLETFREIDTLTL